MTIIRLLIPISLLLLGISCQSSQSVEALPLGDGKFSTTAPQVGYVFLCREQTGGGGAFQDGPWIHGDTWNPVEKTVTVDGAVTWNNAAVSITDDGTTRTITSNALPVSHTTGVFPVDPNDDAYQYDRNPNHISEQSITLQLPVHPTAADTPYCMAGEVGIAVTGVPIFNALDAEGRDAVAHEIQDDHNGHPERTGTYHYHNISSLLGDGLVGYAFDGYPIYLDASHEANLDVCHGHDDTNLGYHYHATQDYPYTISCFHGEPVTTHL